jgi:hypothetical protein
MAHPPSDSTEMPARHRHSGFGLTTLAAMLIISLLAPPPVLADPFPAYRDALSASADWAGIWQTGWTAFYAASLGFNGYQSSEASDAEDRYDARVSAVTSALALGDLLLNPLPRRYDRAQQRYARSIGHPEQQREIILTVAQSESAAYRWQSRVLPGLVSAAAGLVIGIGDDRPEDGAIQFATSMLVNEAKLWTRPNSVRDELEGMEEVTLGWGGRRRSLFLSGFIVPQGLGLVARF